jgi:basic membrane lipoprotein Med (substrate-binding protein (PBP1-ABC) superfamily)
MSSSRTSLVSSLVIVIVIFGSVGAFLYVTNQYRPPQIAIVVLDPGFGDFGVADQARLGMNQVSRNYSVQYYLPDAYPKTPTEAETLMLSLASSGQYDIIMAVGEKLQSALNNAATAYPQQRFAMIGGYVDLPNVASGTFASEQAAFLAGVLAAFLSTQTNYTSRVGILASLSDDPAVTRLINGFTQGLVAANDTYVLNVTLRPTVYLGSYDDDSLAGNTTFNLFTAGGVSVLFAPVRASIVGVRNGMLLANSTILYTKHRMPLVIAADSNDDYYGCADVRSPIAPSWITTSVVSHVEYPIFTIVNATLWDAFPAHQRFQYNLANGGANVTTFTYSSTYIFSYIMNVIRSYKDAIVNGTITVTP